MSLKAATIPKDYDLRRDGITQSLIMGYLKCRVSFLLTLNKWGSDQKNTIFAFGSLTHDALDRVYSYYQENDELPNDTQIRIWINRYVKKAKKEGNWMPRKDERKGEYMKVRSFVIVSEYVKYYADEFKKIEVIGAEDTFNVKFMGFTLRGKKDLRMRLAGKKWILETKTMGRIEENNIADKLAFDFQNLFYITAEELEEPDEPVIGVLYNVVRNPGDKTTGKTLEEFAKHLRGKVHKHPEYYFLRFEVPYLEKDKRDFRRDLMGILTEIDGLLSGRVRAYRNFKNCIGRFRCSYLNACASGTMIGYSQHRQLFSELEEST